jgi:hypothetical protein
MLKRQREGGSMLESTMVEAGIQMLSESCPNTSAETWDLLRSAVDDGLRGIDLRLKESGPSQPDRFGLQEANERLHLLMQQRRRFRA